MSKKKRRRGANIERHTHIEAVNGVVQRVTEKTRISHAVLSVHSGPGLPSLNDAGWQKIHEGPVTVTDVLYDRWGNRIT